MNGHTQNLAHDSICRRRTLHRLSQATQYISRLVASVLAVTSPVNWPAGGLGAAVYTRCSRSRPTAGVAKPDIVALECWLKGEDL